MAIPHFLACDGQRQLAVYLRLDQAIARKLPIALILGWPAIQGASCPCLRLAKAWRRLSLPVSRALGRGDGLTPDDKVFVGRGRVRLNRETALVSNRPTRNPRIRVPNRRCVPPCPDMRRSLYG
jgi:hypothetical protein